MLRNKNLKIITAIEDVNYLKKVAGNISQINEASVIASSKYTTDIIDLCRVLSPDILICDLSAENGSMTTTIREICKEHKCSVRIIATASSKSGEAHISDSIDSGADIFMENLDNPSVLRSSLQIVSRHGGELSPQDKSESITAQKADDILHSLKLPIYHSGYVFLKRAITYNALRTSKLPMESYKIYEKISTEFDTTSRHVERAINSAVAFICKHSDKDDILFSILGYSVKSSSFSLTARELILMISEQFRL